jgi:indoleamine 2,3-dioxygenase
LADRIGCYPFLEYAHSYVLQNYKLIDPKGAMNFENMTVTRMFEGSKDEPGFILTHVIMDAFTGKIVTHSQEALEALGAGNRKAFTEALKNVEDTMQIINNNFEQMWYNSKPTSYNNIRTFILGVKG